MKTRTRLFKVAALFFKIGLDFRKESALARRMGFERAQARMQKTHEKRAKELYDLAVHMGGVLIKLCQFLSARQDILPAPYIATLKGLQDEVPAKPFSEMEKIIREEYADFQDIFTRIDPVPLASASLGQVHRAVLKNGDEVVLKILKPGITDLIDLDFAILHLTFRFFSDIRFFRERMDFESVLEEFVRVTGDELNFRREVFIAGKFRDAFKNVPYLFIPRMYDEYCTGRIIVMEYVRGDKITDKEKWLSRNNDPVLLSRRLIEIYLEQFLFIKLIHFDPHPGNILVLDDSRLALLDFGMAGEITEKMSDGVKRGLTALLGRDYETVIEVLNDLGFLRKGADTQALLPVVEFFFDKVLSSVKLERGPIMAVDLSPIVNELVEIIYTQPITLPVEWAYVGRTIGTLVGITASLHPEINIYEELKPSFDRLMEENFRQGLNSLLSRAGNYLRDLYVLPDRANRFIRRIERGNLKFKVEQSEINSTLASLKNTVIRGIGLIMSFLSAFSSVAFHALGQKTACIFFGICATGFLIFSIFYRQALDRETIRKRITR
jgi:predicted unusual protein kinase regulating ubiquinone biosynthesis (AarF/ABC1/UbiB family)